MRTILLILILAVVALIAAVGTGLINIRQTQSAQLPTVAASNGKVSATGGDAPAFDVQTGSIGVGSKQVQVPAPAITVQRQQKNVTVPAIQVNPAEPATTNRQ